VGWQKFRDIRTSATPAQLSRNSLSVGLFVVLSKAAKSCPFPDLLASLRRALHSCFPPPPLLQGISDLQELLDQKEQMEHQVQRDQVVHLDLLVHLDHLVHQDLEQVVELELFH
jgi:hypothetical protein